MSVLSPHKHTQYQTVIRLFRLLLSNAKHSLTLAGIENGWEKNERKSYSNKKNDTKKELSRQLLQAMKRVDREKQEKKKKRQIKSISNERNQRHQPIH